MRKMLPNILTVLRIVLALTGAWALWQSYFWSVDYNVPLWLGDASVAAATVGAYGVAAFVVAAVTDWLDGWLARRWSAQSAFGALLDPVADKLLVDAYLLVYAMILGQAGDGTPPVYVLVPVCAIVLRDVVITLVRMVSGKPDAPALPVSPAAKLKTLIAFLVTAFPLAAFLLGWTQVGLLVDAWVIALWLTAALSLATGLSYLRGKPRARS